MTSESDGIVYLVGAGPGDPGLITVRAVECLRKAQVVVYDNLANSTLLSHAPGDAELVYAGKKASEHTMTQDEINDLLAQRAAEGKTVVRLKGGDPFVFGRGGEEAQHLVRKGIRWEVVPGISSALAVPTYAGIPVTHRDVNGSVHVITGHESDEGAGPEIDWSTLARAGGTIVVLMGVRNLGSIADKLMANGLAPDTPAALIRWGTVAEQETLITQLDSAADDVARAGMKPPAVCVIGQVVRLREELAWVERRPLFGLRVAVTRPVDENEVLARSLQEKGAEVAHTPTLRLAELPVDSEAERRLAALEAGHFDWLCITSGNGARQFARMMRESGRDMRRLARCKVAAIGRRTAEALADLGIIPDLTSDAVQETLAADLVQAGARRVLNARAKDARSALEDLLQSSGAETQVLPTYEMLPDQRGIDRLQHLLGRRMVHCITFTSARTFQALHESVGAGLREALSGVMVAVIGPVTRAAVEQAGVKVDAEAPSADMAALTQAICEGRATLVVQTSRPLRSSPYGTQSLS